MEELNYVEVKQGLKQALLYFCLFILFRTVFGLVMPYYIHVTPDFNGPIDARVMDFHFFDDAYVRTAKLSGYIAAGYYQNFFPLDLVFPVIYTTMFLSVINVFKGKTFYRLASWLIFTGMILDYLENFSFALYLQIPRDLSLFVACCTTLKGMVFLINGILFCIGVGWLIILLVKTKQKKRMAL